MLFITGLVIKTYQFKVDLVSEDYYGQELRYQETINKMNRSAKIDWMQDSTFVVLKFPEGVRRDVINGKIEFYRPSDSARDFSIPIKLDENGNQRLQRDLFITGLYKIKIDWKLKGTDYYTEEDIYIQ
jgi:hypothetical protein